MFLHLGCKRSHWLTWHAKDILLDSVDGSFSPVFLLALAFKCSVLHASKLPGNWCPLCDHTSEFMGIRGCLKNMGNRYKWQVFLNRVFEIIMLNKMSNAKGKTPCSP